MIKAMNNRFSLLEKFNIGKYKIYTRYNRLMSWYTMTRDITTALTSLNPQHQQTKKITKSQAS